MKTPKCIEICPGGILRPVLRRCWDSDMMLQYVLILLPLSAGTRHYTLVVHHVSLHLINSHNYDTWPCVLNAFLKFELTTESQTISTIYMAICGIPLYRVSNSLRGSDTPPPWLSETVDNRVCPGFSKPHISWAYLPSVSTGLRITLRAKKKVTSSFTKNWKLLFSL